LEGVIEVSEDDVCMKKIERIQEEEEGECEWELFE